jgi:hypothetical protein
MNAARFIATILAAALVAAGCGDDDAVEVSSPTKAEYLARASAVCVEGRHAAEAVFERVGFSGRPSAAEAQRALQALLPVMRESFGGRAALEVPEGEEQEIAAIDEAGAEAVAEFARIAADPQASLALMTGRTPDPATEVDRLSGEYGLSECAGKD